MIDGRNRRRACELAGVEPKVEKLNGEDPVAYIVSANTHRDLTIGQRAIWNAIAAPEAEHTAGPGRGKKGPKLGRFPFVTKQRLSDARIILKYAPDLADQVLTAKGEVSFAKAFEEAKRRKAEAEANEEKLTRTTH